MLSFLMQQVQVTACQKSAPYLILNQRQPALLWGFPVSAESALPLTAQKPKVGCYGSERTNTFGIDQSDCATVLGSRQT